MHDLQSEVQDFVVLRIDDIRKSMGDFPSKSNSKKVQSDIESILDQIEMLLGKIC